jgi:hypothetical protein
MAAGTLRGGIRLGIAILAGCLVGESTRAAPSAQQVDLALVIVTDVSYSVDENEARFQREGAITAFRNSDVVKAIQSGSLGRIAVTYLDFSSYQASKVIVGWTLVHDKASADAFADVLASKPRTLGVQTSISSGLELAERLLETSPYTATKRVIDVSGDGPNNEGHLVDKVRDEIIAKGVVINGLPIMTPADQFAHGFEDLARALRRKLILEISDAQPQGNPLLVKVAASGSGNAPSHASHFVYEKGCDIGERMRFGGDSGGSTAGVQLIPR